MKDDICDVIIVTLAIAIVCVGLSLLISKAVSTATPESATDERPTIENRVDR